MAENLTYKAISGCWAYENNLGNVSTYGYLYDWETAKKVCPSGWHVPSDGEWKVLTDYLEGENETSGKLDRNVTNMRETQNTFAYNAAQFSPLWGGCRDHYNGAFYSLNDYGYWWSATEFGGEAILIGMYYIFQFDTYITYKTNGLSVRCVKGTTSGRNIYNPQPLVPGQVPPPPPPGPDFLHIDGIETIITDEVLIDTMVFIVVDIMPSYPKGNAALTKWIGENLRIPQTAKEKGILGNVDVSFIIEKDGIVTNIKVLRGIDGGCTEEAMRLVKLMPKWIPGILRKKPVRVNYKLSIKFPPDF